MEAVLKKAASFRIIIALTTTALLLLERAEGSWCVARSDASDEALQTALDYACGAGADCAPLQSSGLCFLPNTIQAHASYAFNSFYQRNNIAPGSCDFAGTATLAITDPSYGSCVYPPNPRSREHTRHHHSLRPNSTKHRHPSRHRRRRRTDSHSQPWSSDANVGRFEQVSTDSDLYVLAANASLVSSTCILMAAGKREAGYNFVSSWESFSGL